MSKDSDLDGCGFAMAAEEIAYLTMDEINERLAKVLAEWPLYRFFTYYSGSADPNYPPPVIKHYCRTCGGDQLWSLQDDHSHWRGFCSAEYKCRNCLKEKLRYYFIWERRSNENVSDFMKVGQHPPLEERIPAQLETRLAANSTEDLDYYKKAIRCRNFNYGLAALSYLRRVVENRMNDLLDLMADVAREQGFATDQVAELDRIKTSKVFDHKITFASKILPPSVRPGGQNPVDLLHDIASEGIHNKSEDECIELFDISRHVFEYLFRELEVGKADAERFVGGLKELLEKKAARRPRRDQDK